MAFGETWVVFACRLAASAPLLYCALYLAVEPGKVVQALEEACGRLGSQRWLEPVRWRGEVRPAGFARWIGVFLSLFWLVRVAGLDRWAVR
jgi:hypothetical protein